MEYEYDNPKNLKSTLSIAVRLIIAMLEEVQAPSMTFEMKCEGVAYKLTCTITERADEGDQE